MADKKLNARLSQLAEEFVASVLNAISQVSLQELALVSAGEGGRGASAKSASRVETPARRGRKPGRPPKSAVSAPAKKSKERTLVRRPTEEIEGIRGGILQVLAKASGPVGAKQLAKEIGGVSSNDLSFPMNRLRSEGLVEKHGDRAQTTYSLTEKGRSHNDSEAGEKAPARRGRKKKAAANG